MALRSSVVLTPLADKQSKFLFYFTFFIFSFCNNSKFLPVEKKQKNNSSPGCHSGDYLYRFFNRFKKERHKRGRQSASNIQVILPRKQVSIRLAEATLRCPPLKLKRGSGVNPTDFDAVDNCKLSSLLMVCEGRPGDQQSSRSKPFLLVDVPPPPPDWFGHADNIRLSSESKIQMGAFQDGL